MKYKVVFVRAYDHGTFRVDDIHDTEKFFIEVIGALVFEDDIYYYILVKRVRGEEADIEYDIIKIMKKVIIEFKELGEVELE